LDKLVVIRITKCSKDTLWYNKNIGDSFVVFKTFANGNYIVGVESETYDFIKIVKKSDAVILKKDDVVFVSKEDGTVTLYDEKNYMVPLLTLRVLETREDKGFHIRLGYQDLQDFYKKIKLGDVFTAIMETSSASYQPIDIDAILDIPYADTMQQGIFKENDERDSDFVDMGYDLIGYVDKGTYYVKMLKTYMVDSEMYVYRYQLNSQEDDK